MNAPKEKSLLPITLSVVYATILLCVLGLVEISPLSKWGELSASDKRWMFCTSSYAIALTATGFLYAALDWRRAGITHGLLMLGIAAVFGYKMLTGLLTNPGPDNAAGGVLAAANLIFIVAGALAGICGIVVMRHIFASKGDSTHQK